MAIDVSSKNVRVISIISRFMVVSLLRVDSGRNNHHDQIEDEP